MQFEEYKAGDTMLEPWPTLSCYLTRMNDKREKEDALLQRSDRVIDGMLISPFMLGLL